MFAFKPQEEAKALMEIDGGEKEEVVVKKTGGKGKGKKK
jgi:hypothetical protein